MEGGPKEPLDFGDLLEVLAALEHEQWASCAKHILDNLDDEHIERWKKQIETPYAALSEKEKESDREWAKLVIAKCNVWLMEKHEKWNRNQ